MDNSSGLLFDFVGNNLLDNEIRMKIKEMNKIYLIISLIVLMGGCFYGIDKWADKKISSHPAIVRYEEMIDDNENETLEVKEYMLRLEAKIDKLHDKIDKLLWDEYP